MKTTKHTPRTDWRKEIEQWQESGLTQAAYCKQNNLLPHQLGYWKRKLNPKPSKKSPQPKFAKVNVKPSLQATSCLSLQLPNGYRINGITPENLSALSQILGLLK